MTMTEEQIAARLAEVNAMEARVMAASNREDAIGAEITRLMNERDEARAEAVAAREHTDRAVDEIRRTLPAALRLAAEDEREACAAIAQGIAVAASRAADYTANTLSPDGDATWESGRAAGASQTERAIRARGAGGAR